MFKTIIKYMFVHKGIVLAEKYYKTNFGRYLFLTALNKLSRSNELTAREHGMCQGYVEGYRCMESLEEGVWLFQL